MRKTKFQRVTALVLAFVFLICGTISVAGADSGAVSSGAADISALLNATSYETYRKENMDAPKAGSEIVIDATKEYTFVMADGKTTYDQNAIIAPGTDINTVAHVGEYEGRQGLYIPGAGTISWTTDQVKRSAKYSVVIDYYAVENKSAEIERIFMINGTVPFAEARFLTISKTWKNVYSDGEFVVPAGESADSYLAKAVELGITARSENREDGTYIIYTMPDVRRYP